eukprot:Amastigsp_a346152_14.p6 type:complete len:102 gc:universal Amastigsp_a346152_14:593-288(-)
MPPTWCCGPCNLSPSKSWRRGTARSSGARVSLRSSSAPSAQRRAKRVEKGTCLRQLVQKNLLVAILLTGSAAGASLQLITYHARFSWHKAPEHSTSSFWAQ